ncbi:MAG: hypothetical protein ACI8X5_002205 [Planctomycetota bacterium]|jgi:hypothetical protein
MSDQEWNDEIEVPPKKKGLPGWLMFCGGGCLIAVILTLLGGYFVFSEIKEMADPELQWAELEKATDMDARPPELELMFGWHLGIDLWMLKDNRGYVAVIYDFGDSSDSDRDEIFSEGFDGGGIAGLGKMNDSELGEITVQGRKLPIVRFQNSGGFSLGEESVKGGGAACFTDITPESNSGFMMLFLMRNPGQDNSKADIEDAVLVQFLAPFSIGSDRELYVAPAGHEHEGNPDHEHEADLLEPISDK